MAFNSSDFNLSSGTTAQNIASLNSALSYLQNSAAAVSMLQQLKDKMAESGITLNIGNDLQDGYDANSKTINWNPTSALVLISGVSDATSYASGVNSAAVNLMHEIWHAIDPDLSTYPTQQAGEMAAINHADVVAAELGEAQRYNYNGNNLTVTNTTEHTVNNDDGSMSWQLQVLDGAATVTAGTLAGGVKTATPADLPSVTVSANGITVDNATVSVSSGASISVSGSGDKVSLGDGASAAITSSGTNTVTCDNNTVTVSGNSSVSCVNGNIQATDKSPNASVDVSGTGASVAVNDGTVRLDDGAQATVSGDGVTVTTGAGLSWGLTGTSSSANVATNADGSALTGTVSNEAGGITASVSMSLDVQTGVTTTSVTGYDPITGVQIGRTVQTDDGHGDRTTTNYDANGGITSVKDVATQTDDQGNVTTTTTTTNYDPNGGVEAGHSVSVNDGHGDTSTSTYDGNGNLTSYGWQTEGGASGSNTYGSNGQITNETWNDGNGNSGSNTYDSNGTLESSSWQSNDGHSGTNNYDQNGNLASDSWQSPDGTTGTDTYNSDGSRASDTWQSTGGSYGSDNYNQDGSVASSSVTTVTTNADGSVTTTTNEDNYSTGGGDSYGGGYGGGYGGDYGGGYGGGYGDIYNDTTITTNPDGSSVEVVSTNQYGYGDTTTTVTSADGSYNTTETTAMGITWETSYNATTGEHDNSTIYNDGSRTDHQQVGDTDTTTDRDANGNVTRVEVINDDSDTDITTIYGPNGSVTVDQLIGNNNHLIDTTNPDGSHSETRTSNEGSDSITDNYDASGRLASEDGHLASIPSDYTWNGTIASNWETTYNSDGSSSTHEWEVAGNGEITHDTETDSYGHTVSTATTIEVNGVSDQTTQNADGSHSTAHWDDNGNYDSHQYDTDGHDIHDVSRSSDGSYSDLTYDPATGSTTEDGYNGSTGEHSTYESSYDADGVHHEVTTLDRADGSSETLQTDTINGISLTTDTNSDGTTGYYMNGSGISADQFDQYWQDYFAGDSASNDPGAGDPGTGDPGVADGSTSATSTDVAVGTTDQQAAA